MASPAANATTYTAISDVTAAVDKPVTQSLVRALRDNPIAITEGASGAPNIVPAALNLRYFRASRTSNQNISALSAQKVSFNTEVYDPGSNYDNVTNFRFTPDQAGIYLVGVTVRGVLPTGTDGIQAVVAKNGSSVASALSVQANNTLVHGVTCMTIVQMNGSTDYLEGFAGVVTGSATTWNVQGEFWAVALGKL